VLIVRTGEIRGQNYAGQIVTDVPELHVRTWKAFWHNTRKSSLMLRLEPISGEGRKP
jgi:hypothetical protein